MNEVNKYAQRIIDNSDDKRIAYTKACFTKTGKTFFAASKHKKDVTNDFAKCRMFSRKSDAVQSAEQKLPAGEEAKEWKALPLLIKRCPAFFVTFGRDDLTEEGESLHQYYTKVYALSYNQAIELVKTKYKGNYQFLHREESFDPSKYPKGELEVILQ